MEIQLLLPFNDKCIQVNEVWDTMGFRDQILPDNCKTRYFSSGTKYWLNQNDQLHRLDGPAVEYSSGYKAWYQDDQLHRLDGPAVEYSNGDKIWCIEDKNYTEQQFNAHLKGESKTSPILLRAPSGRPTHENGNSIITPAERNSTSSE